ncbi:MAG: phosphate ABC transporter permease subunit PstC [Deltaproteobacteria bacterium]|nr:MAG: phosphate ABC transporter permease subunit PstC [Deltaproteobacteria bacterium]
MLTLIAAIAVLAVGGFVLARGRAMAIAASGGARLHSLPAYYGWYGALWSALPGLAVIVLWLATAPSLLPSLALAPGVAAPEDPAQRELFWNDVENLARGNVAAESASDAVRTTANRYVALRERALAGALALTLVLGLAGGVFALRAVRPALAARVRVERFLRGVLLLSSTLAILVTIGIVLSLVFETARFFESVTLREFLLGTEWSPQIALRSDQVASSGAFGAVPVFAGTLLITAIAMLVAVPIGLLSAIHMTFYASARARDVLKPLLEILAGVPTVVYGFFAALVVAPAVRSLGAAAGLSVASESALAAGLVMGIMIVPFVSSLSDDAITAVPISLRDGSFGLGATRSETIRLVIIPAALPGIVGGFLLAVSRAIGETMIVVMAAGLAANLTLNPLDAVTTVTVQIVTLLTGDQEFDSPKTLAAFALGLTLFAVTLALNVAALRIVKRYREKYD